MIEEVVGGTAYAVGDCAAHGGDHGYAATATVADHLFGYCLGGHEDTCRNAMSAPPAFPIRLLLLDLPVTLTSNIIFASA